MILISILLPFSAQAAGLAPLHYNARYDFTFAGLRFGTLGIEFNEAPAEYDVTCDIASAGIVRIFTKHSSHTNAQGSGSNYLFPERSYESSYKTKNKPRHVKLTYRANAVSEEIVEPPEDRTKRPAVAPELLQDSYDPLSFVPQLRRSVFEALGQGKNTIDIKIYDGRRLYLAHFTLSGKRSINVAGKSQPVIVATASRTLLGGFTPEEQTTYKAGEPPLTVYFSDDERLLPMAAELTFWLGTVHADLVHECAAGESCLLGNKD